MNREKSPDALARVCDLGNGVYELGREIYDGLRTRSMPVGALLLCAATLQLFALFRGDRVLFAWLSLAWAYPGSARLFGCYYLVLIGTPFFVWALARMLRRRRLVARLQEVFQASGLKNNLGNPPRFLFDRPIDPVTRKLRVTSSVLSLAAFQKAKPALESGLQIYVDEFREVRKLGAVDIVYAHDPMPAIFQPDFTRKAHHARFMIGTTRSKELSASLAEVPHLLVAGQTGGGKSTFLRQFIASLYLGTEQCEFVLVDLKGGLEFQLFENLDRVAVPDSMDKAVKHLSDLSSELGARMQLLKAANCKDIEQYRRKPQDGESKPRNLRRKIIVVDEAAEMFLAGQHATGSNVQLAKRVLSQVARQGRSLGIHLVVATQRPDSRALDPQIKANLPGVLCFQMVNDTSSISVLGNGRATDLPPVPGRAIWKAGADFAEVQTPFLTATQAEELLSSHRQKRVPEPEETNKKGTLKQAKGETDEA